MKLYNVPRNTKVKFVGDDEVFTFDHVDGMYSFCIKDGQPFHPAAWTEVEIVEEEKE